MLLNNKLAILKYSVIGLLLIFLEFLLYTNLPVVRTLGLQIIFIIPFLAYLVLKDFEKQNIIQNYLIASILAYEYALVTGYQLLFLFISFCLIVFITYYVEFHNSRINIYIYSNLIYLGYFSLRVLYMILVHPINWNLSNIILVNIFVPSVLNAILMYLLVNNRLKYKVKASKFKRYTF